MNSLQQFSLHEVQPAQFTPNGGSPAAPVGQHVEVAEPTAGPLLGGRYELLRRMGSDPAGWVFLARDHHTDRTVAATVFDRASADTATAIRFHDEVARATGLNHPNIVRTVDWGADDTTFYLVKESVQGATLAELLADEGPLPAHRAARIGADIAAALAAAHGSGIAHNRLDTSHVIIGASGLVKVAGFGDNGDPAADDPAGDLAAFGAVLQEMVATGGQASPAGQPEVVDALFVEDSGTGSTAPPAGLAGIIDRLVSSTGGAGYSSAAAVEADLRGYREAPEAEPPRPTPSQAPAPLPPVEQPDDVTSSPLFLVMLAAMLMLMIGLAVYLSDAISGTTEATAADAIVLPTVIGDPQSVAVETLAAAGFVVEEEFVENGEVAAGSVFAQDPPARTEMSPGAVITISIAEAPNTVVVPNVVEQTRTDAVDELKALGLNVEIRRETNEVIEADHVISQSLREGDEVAIESDITVVVSSGPERVDVPEIAGTPSTEAAAELEDRGLKNVRWEYEPSGDVPQDSVVRTEPEAGSQIELTAPVTVFVSTGNNDYVPGVLGIDQEYAEQLLWEKGFRPEIEYVKVDPDLGLDGIVIAQGLEAGSLQPLGSQVRLQVGREDRGFFSFLEDRRNRRDRDRDKDDD